MELFDKRDWMRRSAIHAAVIVTGCAVAFVGLFFFPLWVSVLLTAGLIALISVRKY